MQWKLEEIKTGYTAPKKHGSPARNTQDKNSLVCAVKRGEEMDIFLMKLKTATFFGLFSFFLLSVSSIESEK